MSGQSSGGLSLEGEWIVLACHGSLGFWVFGSLEWVTGCLMGADLQVTSQVLDELVSAFDGFGGRLTQACDDIRTGDGQVTGDDPLAGRVHDFAGSWHYGLTQLGQHGHECVKMLRQVGSAFDALDRELASELKRSQGVRSSS